jgi:hypothetical protein
MEWQKILIIVRWLLTKGDVLPQLLNLYERFKAASNISEYFGVAEELCRILKTETADLPPLDVYFSDGDLSEMEGDLQGQATARAIDWIKLIQLAKTLLPFLLMFLEKDKPQD